MIRVFNGDAYAIQENVYDRNTALQFFLNGHFNEYILIYRGGRPLKALSYYDVLYDRDVPETVLYLDQDVFTEARKFFFSYNTPDERWNRAIVVCNRQEEAECIVYYQQNLTSANYPVSEFEEYALDESLDFELLSRADAYIFEEFEEYTAFIYKALCYRFPEKKKVFLDENANLFLHSTPPALALEGNTVRVSSNREKYFICRPPQPGVYCSLDLMTSLFWNNQERCYGGLNPDKKFLLIRFPLYSSGLGDIIRFCMAKVAMTEYLNPEYIPVIDLSIPNDGNQFSGGRDENVWEDFFEPLNGYCSKEVFQSRHVLVSEDKIDAFNPYIMEQYYNPQHMRSICKKYLRLNSEMASYVDQAKKHFFHFGPQRTLGVIARGTDFRYGGFDVPQPMDDTAYIELVKEKITEWKCDNILLATEDLDILERFRQAGFGDKLRYFSQERYRYTDINKPGIVIAKMKKPTNDYHDEAPYLAVLYMLAECKALISNCRCGAFEIADYINGGAYEHCYCYKEGDCL